MRIVHASDWHGQLIELPAADLYVFTGDMMTNHPVVEQGRGLQLWRIDPAVERVKQAEWLVDRKYPHRGVLKSPEAPILCVRGNHDFIAAADLFPGCDVTEFIDNEVHGVLGRSFTGHRGIPWINGSWSDETHRPDLIDRMKRMPRADVYVTHYPPWGILDAFGFDGREDHYGLEEMAYRLIALSEPPLDRPLEADAVRALHLFGHIHECGGLTRQEGNVLFSNAATTFNVIDL